MLTNGITEALGTVSALLLSLVFIAAGLSKLQDRAGTRKAVGEFGAPEPLVGPLALGIPVAELTAAAALLFGATRLVGAIGALVLLAVFSTAVGVSLARGRTPDCHCFGQLHSAPASWKTLSRNALLFGIGVIALTGRGPGAFGWIGGLTPIGAFAAVAGAVAFALAIGGGLAFVTLLRSYGRVLLRLDTIESALRQAGMDVPGEESSLPDLGVDPGSPAPTFAVETVAGGRTSWDPLESTCRHASLSIL